MSEPIGFTSAPIKLAAALEHKRREPTKRTMLSARPRPEASLVLLGLLLSVGASRAQQHQAPSNNNHFHHQHQHHQVIPAASAAFRPVQGDQHERAAGNLRHQTHYLNIVPSTHFQYNEGRQLAQLPAAQERSAAAAAAAPTEASQESAEPGQTADQHIYKRSSALTNVHHYAPLVGSFSHQHSLHPYASYQVLGSQNPSLRRRMMSEGLNVRWTSPLMVTDQQQQQQVQIQESEDSMLALNSIQQQSVVKKSPFHQRLAPSADQEAKLLKQKQHIQYHDQWPALASNSRCHKRTLNFCASVLPFNTTTFPNIIGDTNRFEVKRSLPFFGFLAKSSCNKRLDELLCLLLEPPCSLSTGLALPPCKKFCRLALEGCNEYIPATLAMSSVFDCRQYPDSNDANVCVNLAQGNKCDEDEFKCPDKTCIPRKFLDHPDRLRQPPIATLTSYPPLPVR